MIVWYCSEALVLVADSVAVAVAVAERDSNNSSIWQTISTCH